MKRILPESMHASRSWKRYARLATRLWRNVFWPIALILLQQFLKDRI